MNRELHTESKGQFTLYMYRFRICKIVWESALGLVVTYRRNLLRILHKWLSSRCIDDVNWYVVDSTGGKFCSSKSCIVLTFMPEE